MEFSEAAKKIASEPLNSTLECILPLDLKIRRISDKPENHRSTLAPAITASPSAHTFENGDHLMPQMRNT